MKDFLKDYGPLFGPVFAFALGVLAIYIKFYVDRQVENWRSTKKLKKLIQLIRNSNPPEKYYNQKSKDGFPHADQARNATNAAIFRKKIKVVEAFISAIEDDIFTNCSIPGIQQFQDIKFIIAYLSDDIEIYRNKIIAEIDNTSDIQATSNDFFQLQQTFKRLTSVCDTPQKEFNYIQG